MIRAIEEADFEGWRRLWQGYLDFYREDLPEEITRATFGRLCEASDEMFGYVAVPPGPEGEPIGLVHALLHTSTWTTATYCYLEDLFVSPAARGTSTARDLIETVADEAKARGAVKLYWHTQEFNGRARSLYEQVARNVSFLVYEREL